MTAALPRTIRVVGYELTSLPAPKKKAGLLFAEQVLGWTVRHNRDFHGSLADESPELLAGIIETLDLVRSRAVDTVLVPSRDHLQARGTLKPLEELRRMDASVVEILDFVPPAPPQRRRKEPLDDCKRRAVAERLARGRREATLGGDHCGGPRPFGYVRVERRLRIEPKEAAVVRELFQLVTYHSLSRVVKLFNERGVKPPRANQWSRSMIAYIAKNPLYVGRVRWGPEVVRGKHEAIVTPITFNLANVAIRKRDKRTDRKKES